MSKDTRFVGMDVHADTIAVAVAEGRDRVRSLGIVPNRPEAIRRLLGKVGKLVSLRVCYEAGPTGYALYWQLTKLGVHCDVIAPSLVPTKSGERVKTDRRDAEKLARSYRSGDLTPVWVPDPTNHDHEGGPGRSSNISVINRRIQPTSAADSFTSTQKKERKVT
jgi:transposase